jgi:hypothetical protein
MAPNGSRRNAIRSASSNDEAIAVTVEPVDLDHTFERVDQPNVGHAFASVDGELAFTIDTLASRRDHLTSPVRREL